jgi:hypothetical protein
MKIVQAALRRTGMRQGIAMPFLALEHLQNLLGPLKDLGNDQPAVDRSVLRKYLAVCPILTHEPRLLIHRLMRLLEDYRGEGGSEIERSYEARGGPTNVFIIVLSAFVIP